MEFLFILAEEEDDSSDIVQVFIPLLDFIPVLIGVMELAKSRLGYHSQGIDELYDFEALLHNIHLLICAGPLVSDSDYGFVAGLRIGLQVHSVRSPGTA